MIKKTGAGAFGWVLIAVLAVSFLSLLFVPVNMAGAQSAGDKDTPLGSADFPSSFSLAAASPPPAPTGGDKSINCSGTFANILFSEGGTCFLYSIGNALLWMFSQLVWLAGLLFDFSVKIGIYQIKDYFDNGGVAKVWAMVRDLGNIVFIFFLLWISIQTILGIEGGYKKILIDVIIAALLVNFSLFFTKVIIDTSNIVALQFYNGTVDPSCVVRNSNSDGCLADSLMSATGLQTIYNMGKTAGAGPAETKNVPLTVSNIILITIFGSIFYLIAAFVLLQAAFMFIARTVVLVMLAAVSPIAFVLNIVPTTKKYAKQWWDNIIDQALVAPIFLLFMWVVINLASANKSGSVFGSEGITLTEGKSFADALTTGTSINVIFGFFFLIGLMYMALKITKEYSGDAGRMAVGFGGSALGTLAGGGIGLVGRNILGTAAGAIAKRWTPSTGFGKYTRGRIEAMSKASWDVRNFDVKSAVESTKIPYVSKPLGAAAGAVAKVTMGAAKQAGATVDFGKPYSPVEAARERAKQGKEKREDEAREKARLDEEALKRAAAPADAKVVMDKMTDKEVADLPSDILTNVNVMENLKPGMLAEMVKSMKSGDKQKIVDHIRGNPRATPPVPPISPQGVNHPAYTYLTAGPGQHLW